MADKRDLSWSDAGKLSRDSSELEIYMRQLLVFLLNDGGTVAIRAIEMLRGMQVPDEIGDFAGMSSEQLAEVRERARRFIEDQAHE